MIRCVSELRDYSLDWLIFWLREFHAVLVAELCDESCELAWATEILKFARQSALIYLDNLLTQRPCLIAPPWFAIDLPFYKISNKLIGDYFCRFVLLKLKESRN